MDYDEDEDNLDQPEEKSESTLVRREFKDMLNEGILPSGARFELKDDTIETALAVSEVSETLPWRKKALQCATVTRKVGGIEVTPDIINNMLDSDVIFLSLAWTAQLNGTKFDLKDGGVPCPACGGRFKHLEFGNLGVLSRPDGTSSQFHPVKNLNSEEIPASMRDGVLSVGDTQWMSARRNVPEASWENPDVVAIYRILSCLYISKQTDGPPRHASPKEGKSMKASAMREIRKTMDNHIPHFEPFLNMKCARCGEVSMAPFNQGL